MSDGPPGCNDKGSPHCQPMPVYVDGKAQGEWRYSRCTYLSDVWICRAQISPWLFWHCRFDAMQQNSDLSINPAEIL